MFNCLFYAMFGLRNRELSEKNSKSIYFYWQDKSVVLADIRKGSDIYGWDKCQTITLIFDLRSRLYTSNSFQ